MNSYLKPYLVIVDKDNQVIMDISLYDEEPIIIKDGYSLVQSDSPMELIVNEYGDVFLYE